MRGRRTDLMKVGAFVLVAGALLAGGLLWIAGSRFLRPVDTYTVLFRQSVTGLTAGANVEYQGVVIGRVRDVRLTSDIPPNVAVIIDVTPGTPVREDTIAALIGSIVTGIKYIELQGGSVAAAALSAGGTIPGNVASLEEMRDRLTAVLDRGVRILRRLDEEVLTPANVEKLGTAVNDLGTFADALKSAMETLRAAEASKNLGQIVTRVNDLVARVDLVVSDFYTRRDRLYGGVESALRNLDEAARDARALAQAAQAQLSGPGGPGGGLVGELTAATRRLEETIDVIRSDPSLLLWGREVPEREFEP
jgi:phospholipid/cholesterol/gamma-HCH transport system substrate-binding protein